MNALTPIFVHASPRSGSTYFFNVLRRNKSLMCFNEAIIDVFGRYGKRGVARFKAAQKWNVNHHFLQRDDFDEFVEAWDDVMHFYPASPSFQQYLPPQGVLPTDLRTYLAAVMRYAQSRGRRPVLCEIHSRGRAGALRDAFAGFHIAQYRDPLSQFGSFVRPMFEGGEWGFLTFPLMELGISGEHPLYRLVPEDWRVPVLPWPADDHARRWASAVQYMAMVAASDAKSIERLLRWHLFSWTLSNLAAISYSDFVLDIDKAYEDVKYRKSVIDTLASECGIEIDLVDLTKFSRYHEFEGVDIAAVCDQVESAIRRALEDHRFAGAICILGKQPSKIAPADAVELLLAKLRTSLASMTASTDRRHVSVKEWRSIFEKHRVIWFNPHLRFAAQCAYPFVAPIARVVRRARAYL